MLLVPLALPPRKSWTLRTCTARFRSLECAVAKRTFSSALAVSRACSRPAAFSSVSSCPCIIPSRFSCVSPCLTMYNVILILYKVRIGRSP